MTSVSDLYVRGLEYLEQFQLPVDQWLREIKQEGLAAKVPIVDDDMGRFLRLICALVKPRSILEIGCGISYATHWMLLGFPEAKITALDYNIDRLDLCRKFLKKSGFSNRVELIRT
jgi:predicted O-methyltransferase YrrM